MIYKTTKEILESLSPFISENDVSVTNEEHEKEDGSGKEIGDKVVIDKEKAADWLSKGVQPTETVRALLLNAGVIEKSDKLSPSKTNPKKKKK